MQQKQKKIQRFFTAEQEWKSVVPHVKCHLLLGDWLLGRADMAPDKRVYMWFLIIRGSRDVWIWWFCASLSFVVFGFAARPQIICFSFERGELDRDVLNAGHAGRGELGAGSLGLAEALLTVLLSGRTQLECSAPAKCRKVVSIKSYAATRGRPRTHHTAG